MRSPVAVTLLILSGATAIALCHEQPVVGVLTQETYWSNFRHLKQHKSYIAASYVKAVEASGGRVVPVFTNRTTEYYAYVRPKTKSGEGAKGSRLTPKTFFHLFCASSP